MSDVATFLRARIDEDEAAAQAGYVPDFIFVDGWTPPRVLAECEAKRRIVELHLEHESAVKAYRSPRWLDAMNDDDRLNWRKAEARHAATEATLRALALPYADHPDYREEWKP